MEDKNIENLNSQIEEIKAITDDELDGLEAHELKEKFKSLRETGVNIYDYNKQLYSRMKTAEGFEQDKEGKWVKKEKPIENKEEKKEEKKTEPGEPQLSVRDTLALAKSDVQEDDYDEVLSFAAYKKISVAEALKDKTLKGILSDRVEERRSAEVSETGKTRAPQKPSGSALIAKAQKGDLPEKDEDIEALVKAEMDAKRKKT